MSIYIWLLLAGFFWGTNVIVMKLLLLEIPFLLLATMRVLISCLFIFLYMKMKKISFQYHNHFHALIIGILAIYLNFLFTFLGMSEVKGIDNAFMNALAPILTFIFSLFLLKHKGTNKEYIALFLSVFAFLLSIHFQVFNIKIGFYYLFIGMLLYMLGNVLIQKWELSHSLTLVFYELLYGFIFLFIHCLYKGQLKFNAFVQVPLLHWFLFVIVSGIGFAFIQVIYMKSIEKIGALKTSFYLSLNPMITYVESLLFLREKFDVFHFVGFIILGVAIYMIQKERNQMDCIRKS
ncbi:MAG: DMT family transporter [Erysipelotrichales bacterium]|nr:DMT family transporter [Erysipelotrichales bacterium]